MWNFLDLLLLLSIAFLAISILSLIVKFLFQSGLSYKTHFISMGVSIGLIIYSVVFAVALGESGDSDVGADQSDTETTENIEKQSEHQQEDASENQDESSHHESSDHESHFDGKDLEIQGYSIEITDHEVIQPDEKDNYGEKPIIRFSYDITVDDDAEDVELTPYNAWISTFKAVQDNDPDVVNELDVGLMVDEDESENKEIKPGGTASSSVSYELTDEETPVTLIAVEDRVFNEEIGSHDYSIN